VTFKIDENLPVETADLLRAAGHDIVLRSKRQDKPTVLALAERFIPLIAIEPLAGKLWIVEADRVRIR
jgi:hypothetical protein